jgi:TolB-like protein/cytochrome c-type biogenesis protein CcmH/NrfG
MSDGNLSTDSASMTTPVPAQASPVGLPAHTRWRKLLGTLKHFKGAIVAIAGVGAVLGGLTGYWTSYQTVKVAALPASTTAAPANAGGLSILVLPFANQTGDPQKAYIADALTSSITSDLSRIRDAFIIPSATAFTYKDKTASVQQIGKDAGVRFVLQGNVLSSGEKIRINAQLADTQSGAQVWTQNFDGELGNLFALQDQVTARIGNSIGREMVILAAREAETRKSSPKAADLMLRARALSLKPQSLKNWQQIEALHRQVLSLEPNNAGAMVRLANSLLLQANNFGSGMDERVNEKISVEGRDLAAKAKELDPDNPNVYVAIGLYALGHGDFAGSRRAAETQLSLDPRSSAAYNNLAASHLNSGEPERAIELLTQAINLDPRHPPDSTLFNIGRAYFMMGDNDAAIDWSMKTLEASPAHLSVYAMLAMAHALNGDDAKARAAVADLRRVNPGFKFSEFIKPQSSSPTAYKEWFEKKYLPAARKAGLPEYPEPRSGHQ